MTRSAGWPLKPSQGRHDGAEVQAASMSRVITRMTMSLDAFVVTHAPPAVHPKAKRTSPGPILDVSRDMAGPSPADRPAPV